MNLENHAYLFAKKAHKGQKDDYGKDYFNAHSCQVANILSLVTDDEAILAAGYLHDVLEDTPITYNQLHCEFGAEIADLVNELTHEGKKDEFGFYFPRLHSQKAILIKFADRLSNLSRMNCWNEKRQAQYLKRSKFWKRESFEVLK